MSYHLDTPMIDNSGNAILSGIMIKIYSSKGRLSEKFKKVLSRKRLFPVSRLENFNKSITKTKKTKMGKVKDKNAYYEWDGKKIIIHCKHEYDKSIIKGLKTLLLENKISKKVTVIAKIKNTLSINNVPAKNKLVTLQLVKDYLNEKL